MNTTLYVQQKNEGEVRLTNKYQYSIWKQGERPRGRIMYMYMSYLSKLVRATCSYESDAVCSKPHLRDIIHVEGLGGEEGG